VLINQLKSNVRVLIKLKKREGWIGMDLLTYFVTLICNSILELAFSVCAWLNPCDGMHF